jgi:hypothetical protein
MAKPRKKREAMTASRRQCMQDCPRKHFYAYELKRRPIKASSALRFGTLIHEGLEHVWKGNLAFWKDSVSAPSSLLRGDADPYEIVKAKALISGYHYHYNLNRCITTPDDYAVKKAYETIAVEREFVAPFPNPGTFRAHPRWELRGKIDAIAKEITTGKILIVEHKTTSDSVAPDSSYWDKLTIDAQLSAYFLGASALGYKIDHCLYDVIRKPTIKPFTATPEEKRKRKADGTLYANQREQDETPDECGERLVADIDMRPETYFARREVVRMDGEILDYLLDTWSIVSNIESCRKVGYWPRNTRNCSAMGRCPYMDVCRGCASIEDNAVFETTELNPELGGGGA